MKLSKVSPFSGKTQTMDIPLTEEEFKWCATMWRRGTLIQDAFPMLDADTREFIKTGITPEEWKATFGDE